MKKLLRHINPITFIITIFDMIVEFIEFRKYVSIIERMESEGILEDNGFTRGPTHSIIKGINLRPETLLYGEDDQDKFELGLVASEMKKYNELFAKEGILNMVTTQTDRIKSEDYYGYIVSIVYNFKKINVGSMLYTTIYSLILTYILIRLNYSAIFDFISNIL